MFYLMFFNFKGQKTLKKEDYKNGKEVDYK